MKVVALPVKKITHRDLEGMIMALHLQAVLKIVLHYVYITKIVDILIIAKEAIVKEIL